MPGPSSRTDAHVNMPGPSSRTDQYVDMADQRPRAHTYSPIAGPSSATDTRVSTHPPWRPFDSLGTSRPAESLTREPAPDPNTNMPGPSRAVGSSRPFGSSRLFGSLSTSNLAAEPIAEESAPDTSTNMPGPSRGPSSSQPLPLVFMADPDSTMKLAEPQTRRGNPSLNVPDSSGALGWSKPLGILSKPDLTIKLVGPETRQINPHSNIPDSSNIPSVTIEPIDSDSRDNDPYSPPIAPRLLRPSDLYFKAIAPSSRKADRFFSSAGPSGATGWSRVSDTSINVDGSSARKSTLFLPTSSPSGPNSLLRTSESSLDTSPSIGRLSAFLGRAGSPHRLESLPSSSAENSAATERSFRWNGYPYARVPNVLLPSPQTSGYVTGQSMSPSPHPSWRSSDEAPEIAGRLSFATGPSSTSDTLYGIRGSSSGSLPRTDSSSVQSSILSLDSLKSSPTGSTMSTESLDSPSGSSPPKAPSAKEQPLQSSSEPKPMAPRDKRLSGGTHSYSSSPRHMSGGFLSVSPTAQQSPQSLSSPRTPVRSPGRWTPPHNFPKATPPPPGVPNHIWNVFASGFPKRIVPLKEISRFLYYDQSRRQVHLTINLAQAVNLD
ncbi:hypothetical protein CDD82_5594 [Ophiocordyceps australis]|uniref:Uncharacterized protein n=1 Tax=Ophiocordyceps australis TaxID=1399860 RepID=A0A2C5YWV0_9HYPO|nr:hypothetical protein CDD82_5594 [Ophiocordyceps australis]